MQDLRSKEILEIDVYFGEQEGFVPNKDLKERYNSKKKLPNKVNFPIKKKHKKVWTKEEGMKLFQLYKEKGSSWSSIVKEFPERTKNEIKNKFYSTLRRVATKKNQGNGIKLNFKAKALLQYIDDAMEYGHNCVSKRGRKRKHPIKIETKKLTKNCMERSSESVTQTLCFPLQCTSSVVNIKLSTPFEEWMEGKSKLINDIRKSMNLPIRYTDSAFVPFNNSMNL